MRHPQSIPCYIKHVNNTPVGQGKHFFLVFQFPKKVLSFHSVHSVHLIPLLSYTLSYYVYDVMLISLWLIYRI